METINGIDVLMLVLGYGLGYGVKHLLTMLPDGSVDDEATNGGNR